VSWIRVGSWDVDFEKIGFEPKRISVQISEFKRNPDVDIVMTKVEGIVVSEELEAKLRQGGAT